MKKSERRSVKPQTPEAGQIRKHWRHRLSVALVYPNHYHVGMANLGLQTVYRLLNDIDTVVCERVFLPEHRSRTPRPAVSVESGRPLHQFDLIAFSIAFENDYPNLLTLLDQAALPLRTLNRDATHPLVIAGGVACFLNPEPIAPFIDAFLIGEAETSLVPFVRRLQALAFPNDADRKATLREVARNVTGAYVPQFYQPSYNPDGTLADFAPLIDVPARITRSTPLDVARTPTCSTLLSAAASFDHSYLIEVSRGCPHGCRFCAAGYVYRPPRFRPLAQLETSMTHGATQSDHVGLVGAAVSDLPDLVALCHKARAHQLRLSFSSLRADAMNDALIEALRTGNVKTATIAPDAGSERMRCVINKGLDEQTILAAAEALVAGGIPNLKLYFMIGLPTEEEADVLAVVTLCKRIKHHFLQASRARKRIGTITVSVGAFVPKPFTPFQWSAMDATKTLKQKIRTIKAALKTVPNLNVHTDVPRWAYIQALLARGDRRVADLLEKAHQHNGNWPRTLKEAPLDADFYILRERDLNEILPWDFIDHGIEKKFLQREFKRAVQGRLTPACRPESCTACGVCG